MKTQWWCVSCLTQIELDHHGRCGNCGSDAVDRIEHGRFEPKFARTQNAPLSGLYAETPRMGALSRGGETHRY